MANLEKILSKPERFSIQGQNGEYLVHDESSSRAMSETIMLNFLRSIEAEDRSGNRISSSMSLANCEFVRNSVDVNPDDLRMRDFAKLLYRISSSNQFGRSYWKPMVDRVLAGSFVEMRDSDNFDWDSRLKQNTKRYINKKYSDALNTYKALCRTYGTLNITSAIDPQLTPEIRANMARLNNEYRQAVYVRYEDDELNGVRRYYRINGQGRSIAGNNIEVGTRPLSEVREMEEPTPVEEVMTPEIEENISNAIADAQNEVEASVIAEQAASEVDTEGTHYVFRNNYLPPEVNKPDIDSFNYSVHVPEGEYNGANGVLSVLGSYFSEADKAVFKDALGSNRSFSQEQLQRAGDYIQWLFENGYTFTASSKLPGTIDLLLDDLDNNVRVRVLDSRNINNVGRIYNTKYVYYLTPIKYDNVAKSYVYNRGIQQTFESSNVTLDRDYSKYVLRYLRGDLDCTVQKFKSGDNSLVLFDDMTDDSQLARLAGVYGNNAKVQMALRVEPVDDAFSSTKYFVGEDLPEYVKGGRKEANVEPYLRDMVESARENFIDLMKMDALVEAVQNQIADIPTDVGELLSDDPNISSLQLAFMDDVSYIYSYTSEYGTSVMDLMPIKSVEDFEGTLAYNGIVSDSANKTEMIEMLKNVIVNTEIGDYDNTLNPSGVRTYGTDTDTRHVNVRDALQTALILANYPPEQIIGGRFDVSAIKSRLIKFNPETAVARGAHENSFMNGVMDVVYSSLKTSGVIEDIRHPISISMDDNGIIHWSGYKRLAPSNNMISGEQFVEGDIGQIFAPDENGLIETKFQGGRDNYLFAPGYSGYFTTEGLTDNPPKSAAERLRVRGFDITLNQRIRELVRSQLVMPAETYTTVEGDVRRYATELDATALNSIYRGEVYGERLDLDFYNEGKHPAHIKQAIIESMLNKVHFSKRFAENCTTDAAYRVNKALENGSSNLGASRDAIFGLVDYSNMRIVDEDRWKDYVDLDAIGSDQNQGLSLYLAEGARVAPDGSIVKAPAREDGKPNHCALLNIPEFDYGDFTATDRKRMAANQIPDSHGVTYANIAYMTFEGWTFDDANVVSKKFAEENSIISEATGEFRPLARGDKLSDFDGNKGIISMVVDPDMSDEEAEEKGLFHLVELFRRNPELDIISGPGSQISRCNAGLSRFALSNESKELYGFNGEPLGHGLVMGRPMIIPEQDVEHKTTLYNAPGEGRKASGQLTWAFTSAKALDVLHYFYKDNTRPWQDLREYMILYGMDVDIDGNLLPEYQPRVSVVNDGTNETITEARNEFFADGYDTTEAYNEAYAEYMRNILSSGGFLMIPAEFGKFSNIDESIRRDFAAVLPRQDFVPAFFRDSLGTDSKKKPIDVVSREIDGEMKEFYRIPVLPPHLREGTTALDGEFLPHEYTSNYAKMFQAVNNWYTTLAAVDKAIDNYTSARDNDELKKASVTLRGKLRSLSKITESFDSQFNNIQSSVIERQLNGTGTGKHSFFRDNLMGVKVPDSATAVFMPDPRLKIGEIAMNSELMATLGVKEGETILFFRDPVLRDGAVRAGVVVLDEEVHGAAVNPVCDKSLDGDFDGDTLGLLALHGDIPVYVYDKDGNIEYGADGKPKFKLDENGKVMTRPIQEVAMEKFGYASNLLDLGSEPSERPLVEGGKKPNITELYPLYFNFDMDFKTAEYINPDIAKLRMRTEIIANEARDTSKSLVERQELQKKALAGCQSYVEFANAEVGLKPQILDFENPTKLYGSLETIVKSGHKGSPSKLQELISYMGLNLVYDKYDENGLPADGSKLIRVEVNPDSDMGKEAREGIQLATGVKTDNTGKAGTISQSLVSAFRDFSPKAALEATYVATQANLQIKHDPKQAEVINDILSFDLKNLYNCRTRDGKGYIKSAEVLADELYKCVHDDLGLGVDKWPFEEIAKLLEKDGLLKAKDGSVRMKSPAEFRQAHGAFLDLLAYGGSEKGQKAFDYLVDGAERRKNFFRRMDGQLSASMEAFRPTKGIVEVDSVKENYVETQKQGDIVRAAKRNRNRIEQAKANAIEEEKVNKVLSSLGMDVEDSPITMAKKRQMDKAMAAAETLAASSDAVVSSTSTANEAIQKEAKQVEKKAEEVKFNKDAEAAADADFNNKIAQAQQEAVEKGLSGKIEGLDVKAPNGPQ